MAYILQKYQIREQEFLVFDALRQAAQCVGRVIRSKEDYGVVILADFRYNKQDKRNKMPQWIQQFLRESSLNVSTDVAIDNIKAYVSSPSLLCAASASAGCCLASLYGQCSNLSLSLPLSFSQYSYLKLMGQPIDRHALEKIVLNEAQVKEKQRGVSQYRLQATQVELERISRESAARRPGLFGQQDKNKAAAVSMAAAAAALGAGFDVDPSQQEAMVIAQAQEEEEEAERREAERYIEEEEANLMEDIGERLPDGSILETRRVSSDLVLSINKRSTSTLDGSSSSSSTSAGNKRGREASSSSASEGHAPTASGVTMFVDSDDD